MEYSREKLNSFGIYELRTIARQLGVYSPTLFKKDELITKIEDIMSGKEKPYVRKTKQGRPAKGITKLNDIIEVLSPYNKSEGMTYLDNIAPVYDIGKLKTPIASFDANKIKFSGLYNRINEEYGMLFEQDSSNSNKKVNCIITDNLIKEYKLKEGDLVKCLCNFVEDEKTLFVSKVLSINNVASESVIKREDFFDLEYQIPTRVMSLSEKNGCRINNQVIDKIAPLFYGGRTIVNIDQKDNDFFKLKNLNCLFKLNNPQAEVTLISINDMPEIIQYIKNNYLNVNVLTNSIKQHYKDFRDFFDLQIQHIIRNAEMGKDEIVIINDYEKFFDFIASGMSFTDSYSIEKAKIRARKRMFDAFKMAKENSNAGSISMFFINCYDETLKSMATTYLKYNLKPYKNSDLTLNVKESFSKNLMFVLDEKKYLDLCKIKNEINDVNVLEKLEQMLK